MFALPPAEPVFSLAKERGYLGPGPSLAGTCALIKASSGRGREHHSRLPRTSCDIVDGPLHQVGLAAVCEPVLEGMKTHMNNDTKTFPAMTAGDITALSANGEPVVPPPPAPITTLSFRVAKTMPECPHEYAVRSPENEREYVRMYEAVRKHGVYQRWRGRKRQYWYAGDGFKYWVMTSNIFQSRILNRTRVDEPTAAPDPERPARKRQ